MIRLAVLAGVWLGLSLAARAGGLAQGPGGPLRTAYTHVKVTVDGTLARTVVTQVFVNDQDHPVEVSYGFPLPEDATVAGFAEWRDGRRVEARAEAKETAEAAYEAASARGERASLLTTDGPRFRMTLLALPGKAARRVELSYVQTVPALAGEQVFTFPADAEGQAPAVLDVEVEVGGPRPVLALRVPNQPDALVVSEGDGRYAARLSRAARGLALDLVVRWQVPAAPVDLEARSVALAEGPGAFEARFAFNADPRPEARAPRDVVVVVDASLSMAGAPLKGAVAAAQAVLAGLDPLDRFAVIWFADRAQALSPGWQEAHPDHRAAAAAALGKLRPGGRSDLQGALDLAAAQLASSVDGVLVLLTDGQPTASAGPDPYGLDVDLAAFARSRVVLGHFNYPGQARALEAAFESLVHRFVPDGPAGLEVAAELARLAVAPVIEDLAVEIDGEVYAVHGALPGRLPLGGQVRLVGRLEGPVTIRVRGVLHGMAVERSVTLEAPVADGAGDRGLGLEWARARVAALEERLAPLPKGDPARESFSNEIKDLGTRYGFATRLTAYAITDRLAPDRIKPGDPELRIHAPQSAERVFALMPWGEEVDCAFEPAEGLWLGRFLVPRGTPDGLYRARIFVVHQGVSAYRGALLFQVDSQPPPFTLSVDTSEGPARSGDLLLVEARPREARIPDDGGAAVDRVVRDPLDLRQVTVQLGAERFPLTAVGDEQFEAWIPVTVGPGRHRLRLVAEDWARNQSVTDLMIEVR